MTTPQTVKVAFLHTVPGLAATFEELLAKANPDVDGLHIVDRELFRDGTAEPGLAFDRSVTGIIRHVQHVADRGAKALVVTCATLGPATDVVAGFSPIPVVRIDRPMAERAIEIGSRIGVLATFERNRTASRELVEDTAATSSAAVKVLDELCDDAFALLEAGDTAGHDRLVVTAIEKMSSEVDVVVLAQASMARAAALADTHVPVLSSPQLAVDRALALIKEAAAPAPALATTDTAAQLRIYRIRDGLMPQWLEFFEHTLIPLHHLVGIRVPHYWVGASDPQEFVWMRQFRTVESVEAQEAEFFGTPPRVALGGVRERYVAAHEIRVIRL